MRVNDEYRHFVAIVAGENPEGNMEPYDMNKKTDTPYVVYKIEDAKNIREGYIDFYKALLKSGTLSEEEERSVEIELNEIKQQSDLDFFYDITSEYEYDFATGDAITMDNPNGKWISKEIGKRFSLPFILKNGKESFQARKKDIDWDRIHLNGRSIYEAAWDMVVDDKKPETPQEEEIYENMKNRLQYFLKFGNKENYVISSTAFWGFAFVNGEEWLELEDDMDQFEWMSNFYSKFIEPLSDDTLLTIYECRRD